MLIWIDLFDTEFKIQDNPHDLLRCNFAVEAGFHKVIKRKFQNFFLR